MFKLTNPQLNIWFSQQFLKDSNACNICGSGLIKEKVDIPLLKQAIVRLVQENDSFRIRLTVNDSEPFQYIAADDIYGVDDISVVNLPSTEYLMSFEEEFVKETFSLLDSRLFTFKLAVFPNGYVAVVLNLHHIISDSWSMGITIQEIVKIYHCLLSNKDYVSDTVSYTEHILAEQKYLDSKNFQKDKTFWMSYLQDPPTPTSIPSLSDNFVDSPDGSRLTFRLDKQIMERINKLCSDFRVSNYVFFMSVISLFLANAGNVDDVLIGTPILNRANFKEKRSTGMFVTTVPFRTHVFKNMRFSEFLEANRSAFTSILRHQKYPYSQLMEDLGNKDNSISHLYNIAVSYQITKTLSHDNGDCELNWAFTGNCMNDISIHLYDLNDIGSLEVDYDFVNSKYTQADVMVWHNRLCSMIEQVVSMPDILLQNVQFITDKERLQLTQNLQSGFLDCPLDCTIIDLFQKQVRLHPDSIACVYQDTRLTYSQLDKKANQLAHYLSNQGVKSNDIVGVCMHKNDFFVISILAILKLGAAYLPMSFDYPEDRIRYILTDSHAKLFLTDQLFKLNDIKNLVVSRATDISLDDYSSDSLHVSIASNRLCYVIYTSGSTGRPKGVMLTHRNLVNFLYTFSNCFENGFSNEDVCLSSTNISFDVSVCELFTPLCFGATLVLYPQNTLTDIPLLCELLEEEQITFLYIPPNILNDVYNYVYSHCSTIALNKMLVGVEAIKKADLRKYFNLNENIEIVNGYGPTEATICSTFYKYTKEDDSDGIVPIGYPLKNNIIVVINHFGNIMPIGYPGELCISGENVSKGYLHNVSMNEKSYILLPGFGSSLFYRTGDIVRWDKKGYLCFMGRNDSQIKLHGHRIELQEITNRLKNISGVKNALILVKSIEKIDCLCAYVILEDNSLSIENLKLELSKLLPYYMIPSHFILLDKFPVTKNGKIDISTLPDFADFRRDFVGPTNSMQAKLHDSLCHLLGLKQISIDENFFTLGMDSLQGIRFCLEIEGFSGKAISITDLFQYPTIQSLAIFLSGKDKKDCIVKLKKATPMPSYPLSSAQERIYYATKMAGDSLVYHVSGGILINDLLDIQKIREAFSELVERHPIFRTYFKIENGEVRQFILKHVNLDIPYYDDGISTPEYISELVDNFPKIFDLDFAPLLRVEVHYINSSTLILLDSHHIILDGTSLYILLSDFCKLYQGQELDKSRYSYTDYTMWENDMFSSEAFLDYQEYWKNKFKDLSIPVINLPYDYPVTNQKSYDGERLTFKFDTDLFNAISDIASNHHVSEYMVFLSALYLLLYLYTGQETLIIGSPIESRYHKELNNMIGMFVNNVVLAIDINSDCSFLDLLQQVKETVLDGLSHQPYPYNTFVKDINVPANSSVFDVVFTYQNEEVEQISLNNKSVELYGAHTHTAKFPLTVEINPSTLEISFEYQTALFAEETIDSLYKHYLYILQHLSSFMDLPLHKIPALTEEENNLLQSFNNTAGDIEYNSFVEIFENQVMLHPEDIAIICDGKNLTYKELNKKANSLAHYLISQGIKPNDIVCIMTNRSFETIVCMLGILKAGAAFLNVDPTYPIERTKYYLKDCKAKYVLVQKSLKKLVKNIEHCIEIDLDSPIYLKHFNNPNVTVNSMDLSYVIYTSGSTGKPKGVMLHQIGLANMVIAMGKVLEYLKDGNEHCLVSVTSTPFDIFVYEILVSLGHGLRILMANNEEHRNPILLDKLIKQYGGDVMTVTPSLMKINYDNRVSPSALSQIKHMVFGGEPLPEKFVKDLRELSDNVTIYNIYGPSEITVLCNVQNLNGEDRITIGPPILNTQIHILDKYLRPVPIGVVGEIYISGIQVGLGYLGKPDMTHDKFIDNPFGTGKMYKSGDIGKWTFDGKVQCLGRIDNQIKLRGLRIELGEIEGVMEQIPGVISSVAHKVCIEDREFLCGYYVCDENSYITEGDVKDILKKNLPAYMVPTYIFRLEEMPYTINRKIDRKALPIPDINERKVAKIIDEIKTPNEKKLWNIWKRILHLDDISIYDNFFDIGGDSILAINMQIDALREGFDFEYADIFNFPTIHQLSAKTRHRLQKGDIENYNYQKFDELLSKNSEEYLNSIKKVDTGNVFLIGGTGYVGAHLIGSFLKRKTGDIYCLIRKKDNIIPYERLKNTLQYYFGEAFYDQYSFRIHVIEGDITEQNLSLSEEDTNLLKQEVSTVIHAGAIVKHYGNKELFENINILGTANVVSWCKEFNKRLFHISTISVSGNGEKEEAIVETSENINDKVIFSEKDLFVGQHLKGIYTITKFKAERIVLEAILDGLDAMILRIGNISNRYRDGRFQRNIDENAFAKRIQSFVKLGAFPAYALQHEVEVTPVDLCADAIIRLTGYTSDCTVLHIYDTKLLSLQLFADTLTEFGYNILPVSNEEMTKLINEILEDDDKKQILSGIIHDLDSQKQLVYTSRIRLDSTFSEKFLQSIGFYWKNIDKNYIIQYIKYFKRMKFL